MALNLLNLDQAIRQLMLKEIDVDINSGKLYISTRLSLAGAKDYPVLLKEAVKSHDDSWLADQLNKPGKFNTTETRNTKSGTVTAKVPYNANEVLAEGEFNRFYLRALCVFAQENSISKLVAYRAKQVSNPRPESEAMIGQSIDPAKLIDDLRTKIGVDTALGLPAGPNSGLSAKLPE